MATFLYIAEMRQRLGLKPGDASRDEEIARMSPRDRLRMLCAWQHLGDPSWAVAFLDWARDAGSMITEGE